MKILVVHNTYQQPGGEDVVVEQETSLLKSAGHEVIRYNRSNHEIREFTLLNKLTFPKQIIWSRRAILELKVLIQQENPDVAHFHNTFVMISPAAYYACKELGIPVVQTLHNYRLFCPRGDFFRSDHICEDCLGKSMAFPSVIHRCYHDSCLQSLGVAMVLLIHRRLKTWQEKIDSYIALTEFARQKYIQGGFPRSKFVVKPNFVLSDPGVKENSGGYALYVGRFSPEKKILTLLYAMKNLPGVPLRIVGGGPEEKKISECIRETKLDSVKLLGCRSRQEVFALIKKARFMIFPSELYEGFPMTIAESFACGVPVISSRLGSMEEIIEDGRNGLHFTPGDSNDLAAKIEWAWSHPQEMAKMGREARREYEAKYTAARNYEMLMDIYKLAIDRAKMARQ
jgi:glycosyltransferase involved in cell wall biosynthesis